MNYSELYENKKRGSFDFPIELYYVDGTLIEYNFNKKPNHCNFSLSDGYIKPDKNNSSKTIFIFEETEKLKHDMASATKH